MKTILVLALLGGAWNSLVATASAEKKPSLAEFPGAILVEEYGLAQDPEGLERVRRMGQRLLEAAPRMAARQGLKWELQPADFTFNVLDTDEINAFACGPLEAENGTIGPDYPPQPRAIYVTRGLLAEVRSDDELAGAIAGTLWWAQHDPELGVSRRVRTFASCFGLDLFGKQDWADFTLIREWTRGILQNPYEQGIPQADEFALRVAHEAGFDPTGWLTVLERRAREERARPTLEESPDFPGIGPRTHPFSVERSRAVETFLRAQGWPIHRSRVDPTLRATARPATEKPDAPWQVWLDGVFLWAPAATPEQSAAERAEDLAARLNEALFQELLFRHLVLQRKDGNQQIVRRDRGEVLLEIRAVEAKQAGMELETLARQVWETLRNRLLLDAVRRSY